MFKTTDQVKPAFADLYGDRLATKLLGTEFHCSDLDRKTTIREYFRALLSQLWGQGEGFSGKRPFGNSGWQFDICKVLIEAGTIPGKLDADGCVEEADTQMANKVVQELIARL